MNIAAVIGSPIAQSLSPAMHNAVFASRSLDWSYLAIEIQAGELAEMFSSLVHKGIRGLSITMPHKDSAYALVDQLDEAARLARSVNTVSVVGDLLVGSNTDGDGCCNALESAGATLDHARVAVLGAGGTARAIVEALGRRGASEIVIINRTIEKAHDAVSCAANARVGQASDIASASILINATSVGMNSVEMPVNHEFVHGLLCVLDAVYSPLETALLRVARAKGATTIDGLWMLAHQAALQQQVWLGVPGDVQLMRQAALDDLAQR